MTIRTTAPISFVADIIAEFNGVLPHQLTEYYRGGANVPNETVNNGVPTAGQISITDFYGAEGITVVVPGVSRSNFTSLLLEQTWIGQSTNAGVDSSTGSATLTFNPAVNLTVAAQVSSEVNYDWGSYSINGARQWRASGTENTTGTFNNVTTFQAEYRKDGSVHRGSDLLSITLTWTTA